ncbi:hypothetical protein I9X38_08935 [Bacillus mojavensis]|nr:hypothetical protein I9X38_08935 [Bacillus mojavensis]
MTNMIWTNCWNLMNDHILTIDNLKILMTDMIWMNFWCLMNDHILTIDNLKILMTDMIWTNFWCLMNDHILTIDNLKILVLLTYMVLIRRHSRSHLHRCATMDSSTR